MANVSTEGMNAAAGSISSATASARAAIENMKSQANKILGLSERIDDYNNNYVSGYEPKIITEYEPGSLTDGGNPIQYNVWKSWVTSSGSIGATVSKIVSELEELEAALDDFDVVARETENKADVIDAYMSTIMSQLGNNIDQSTLMGAFRAGGLLGALKLHIAYDAEQAAKGQFIADDKILSEYWTDKPISFKRQENGTYAIYQEDDNGNQVLMGFTTSTTVLGYMTSLGKAGKVIKTNSNDNYVQMVENDEKDNQSKNGKKYTTMEEGIRKQAEREEQEHIAEALEESKKKNKSLSEVVEDAKKNSAEYQKSNSLSGKVDIKTNEKPSILDKVEQPKPVSTNSSIKYKALSEKVDQVKENIAYNVQYRHAATVGSDQIKIPNDILATVTDKNGIQKSYSGVTFQWQEDGNSYYNVNNPSEVFSADAIKNAIIDIADES